jgi:hypothetical protein
MKTPPERGFPEGEFQKLALVPKNAANPLIMQVACCPLAFRPHPISVTQWSFAEPFSRGPPYPTPPRPAGHAVKSACAFWEKAPSRLLPPPFRIQRVDPQP